MTEHRTIFLACSVSLWPVLLCALTTRRRSDSKMTYNSVAEIFDDIDSTRVELLRSVEGLSAERRDFRPSPDRWSVAEIVEHLSIVEGNVVRLLGTLLEKAEDGEVARAADVPFAPVSIEEFVEQSRGQKFNAPE